MDNATDTPWLIGLCHVVFDVDYGQKISATVPEDVLSEEEQQDVGFHSFPDCMSMEMQARSSVRDSSFFFRILRRGTPGRGKGGSKAQTPKAAQSPKPYIYGFVFCRQRMDASLKRGGEQSSVVVLSDQPYSTALKPLSQIAGPLFYNTGPAALKQVWREVLLWPPPVCGPMLQLTVDMVTITARLPPAHTLPLPLPAAVQHSDKGARTSLQLNLVRRSSYSSDHDGHTPNSAALNTPASQHLFTPRVNGSPLRSSGSVKAPTPRGAPDNAVTSAAEGLLPWPTGAAEMWAGCGVAGSVMRSGLSRTSRGSLLDQGDPCNGLFAEVDLWTPFQTLLPRLWALWELVLLGKPLMVVAPSPAECSTAVAALVSLIAPLPYACDFRPYYTIQDVSCRVLISGTLPTPDNDLPCIIGVTNPYFIKALQHWPYVLAVGTKSDTNGATGGKPGGSGTFSSPLRNLRQRRQGFASLLQEHTIQLWCTGQEPRIRHDHQQLLRLAQPKPSDPKAKTRAARVNSEELHKYFHALTSTLLSVFTPYFEPQPDASHVAHWDPQDFLAGLQQPGAIPPLLLERYGNSIPLAVDLYARFLHSPNFTSWLERRRSAVAHLLPPDPQLGLQMMMMGSRADSSQGHGAPPFMDEVGLVESFFRTEQLLLDLQQGAQQAGASNTQQERMEQLKAELQSLFAAMPEDLQQTMVSSPVRRELLFSAMQAPQRLEPLLDALQATLQVQS